MTQALLQRKAKHPLDQFCLIEKWTGKILVKGTRAYCLQWATGNNVEITNKADAWRL